MGRSGGLASLLLYRQTQKVKIGVECGFGKVLCSLTDFLNLGKSTAAKTKLTKCEVRAVLLVLMAKHYPLVNCTMYRPKVMSYMQKLVAPRFHHLKLDKLQKSHKY